MCHGGTNPFDEREAPFIEGEEPFLEMDGSFLCGKEANRDFQARNAGGWEMMNDECGMMNEEEGREAGDSDAGGGGRWAGMNTEMRGRSQA